MKQYIETGRIVTTHGVRGEVKIQPWSDSPAFLAALRTLYLDDGTPLPVERARAAGSVVLCKFQGVETMDEAERLRGKVVSLDRNDAPLPEGQYFICDLIGLTVRDADTGVVYGRLTDVSETGANDVYHVGCPDGREVLMPAIEPVVLAIDLEAGEMRVRPLRGLFDDAD